MRLSGRLRDDCFDCNGGVLFNVRIVSQSLSQ